MGQQISIDTSFGAVSDTQLEETLGLASGTLDNLENGDAIEGRVAEVTTVTVSAGTIITFDWNFRTNEHNWFTENNESASDYVYNDFTENNESANNYVYNDFTENNESASDYVYNDFTFITIGDQVMELVDTRATLASSSSSSSGTFSYTFTEAGTYTISAGVVDVEDSEYDSALAIENVNIVEPGLRINFNFQEDTPENVQQGFEAAAALWSKVLADNVELTIDVKYQDLPGNQIGGTDYQLFGSGNYGNLLKAFNQDATSETDKTAYRNLPQGDFFPVFINETLENPSPEGKLDNNNSLNNRAWLTTPANLKALGATNFLPDNFTGPDATITLDSSAPWDFDRSDGIAPDKYDFVGAVAHEIGHALGFDSSINRHDANVARGIINPADNTDNLAYVFDLFRFSKTSASDNAIDLMVGSSEEQFFSIDRGQTPLGALSAGFSSPDHSSAGHWKPGLNQGIMEPSAQFGQLLSITDLDLTAFDVIGWDLA